MHLAVLEVVHVVAPVAVVHM